MVTDTDLIEVTEVLPVDISAVRDPGMRALVLLGASLGWNVVQKLNNPVTLIARDGTQKRLPTNTSIRISVFQTALSTIILHTEGRRATPQLIDNILRQVKVDRDHERRLRLAVGESPEEHKARLANDKPAEQKRTPDEHLTQHIEVPSEPTTEVVEPPFDGRNHGELVHRGVLRVYHGTSVKYGAKVYDSMSTIERRWSDGFIDFECILCGKAFKTSRGVGSHRQRHIYAGEAERDDPKLRAKRNPGIDPNYVPKRTRNDPRSKKNRAAAKPLPEVEVTPQPLPPPSPPSVDDGQSSSADILTAIRALIVPKLTQELRAAYELHEQALNELRTLRTEAEAHKARIAQLEGDFDALRDLLGGKHER